ncbi:hypothetical protein FE257_008530 [Aspergillus nanangensis]|uniref:Uncharacterized protein n=1 Tax=Aspergillus nanangensis TaxID=2582783 RepID=A0AAD4GUM4_ASPNN|nr:hypothetical protein FE257_008530 [Aspergillus nanangensis]
MATDLFALPVGQENDPQAYKTLVKQVWWGVTAGFLICLAIGGAMLAIFYGLGVDKFAATEDVWEGTFSIISSLVISVMGAALLRVSKLQDKWQKKLSQSLEANNNTHTTITHRFKAWTQQHALFFLPFVTVLREGLEAVAFIGGVGLDYPVTAFPLAVAAGLVAGFAAGYLLYRSGNTSSLQMFLICSTCFLYLVAAGLMSKGVWYFENNAWNQLVGGDASETGSGPGSYDIRKSVWHVNCCNPELDGGGLWGIFNGILGWTNSATYGSVISYNLYWAAVIVYFGYMRHRELRDSSVKKRGNWSAYEGVEPDTEPLLYNARPNNSTDTNEPVTGYDGTSQEN